MPRQNVYMRQKTIDDIRKIVDDRRAEGATTSDANISSVCSEMLELGIRVYIKAKSNSTGDNKYPEERLQKEMMTEVVKSRLVSQQILKLIFDLQEIKSDSRNNYDKLVDWLKAQTESQVESVFKKD